MSTLNRFKQIIILLFIPLISCLIVYEIPHRKIRINQVNKVHNDLIIRGYAKDLVVQDADKKGIWASRGYNLYYKKNDENYFVFKGKVPIPFGISYFLKFRIVRQLLNEQEVLELLITESNNIIAFAGGYIFKSLDKGKSFMRRGHMKHYGYGVGRGVMPQGYAEDMDGDIYWGEYWRNDGRQKVQLFKSDDSGDTWTTIYSFSPGTVRHIHSVQFDPYFNAIWLALGDSDTECRIMYSTDGGQNFTIIGSGSQKWRAVSLIFTKDAVLWGMDGTSQIHPYPLIWSWNRETMKTEKQGVIDSYAFYSARTSDNINVISTDGTNRNACLWINRDEKNWVQSASWSRKRDNYYGTIRLVSYFDQLVITNINLEWRNNDLLIIDFE